MTLEGPRDSTIAIVGDGFGSSFVYTTAVYLGFRPEQVTVFGPNASPVDTYQQFAFNLGQTVLRSESESHFLPADWPTFAQLDAWARRSPVPLLRSIRRRPLGNSLIVLGVAAAATGSGLAGLGAAGTALGIAAGAVLLYAGFVLPAALPLRPRAAPEPSR